jgi:hypothetical protein
LEARRATSRQRGCEPDFWDSSELDDDGLLRAHATEVVGTHSWCVQSDRGAEIFSSKHMHLRGGLLIGGVRPEKPNA